MWKLKPSPKKQKSFLPVLPFLAFLVLAFLLLAARTHRSEAQGNAWQATYWNNRFLAGTPVLQRPENDLNHDWGAGSPHPLVNADEFSARWIRTIELPSGNYRFTAVTDNGMRVWVNDALIIDAWQDSQIRSLSADIFLLAGEHQVKVEYYEAGGEATAQLARQLLTGFQEDWLARYYNNMTLSGEPALVRHVPQINLFLHGAPIPELNEDHFSISWSQDLPLEPGRYRFAVTADDGARLWVNDQLVIDAWQEQSATTYTVEVNVPGGLTPVYLEYYENKGISVAQLSWTRVTAVTDPVPPSTTAWQGEYYNNITLNGSPVMVRDDAQINFNWGTNSPAATIMNADRFAVRWTRTLNLLPGLYEFTTRTDDGVRLWLNDQLFIDQWQVRPVMADSTVINHTGGTLPVVMEYFENTGVAEARLTWVQIPSAPPADPDNPIGTMSGAAYLNVRSGPGLAYESFTHLIRGQTVPLVGRDQQAVWLHIILPGGSTGWVSSRYMVSDTPFVTLPIVE